MIDSHILCTPAIGDIDADGHEELVVAASYFFDRDYYDAPVKLLTEQLLDGLSPSHPRVRLQLLPSCFFGLSRVDGHQLLH